MKNYTELFLGVILAGVLLITLGLVFVSMPGAFGAREVRLSAIVADPPN